MTTTITRHKVHAQSGVVCSRCTATVKLEDVEFTPAGYPVCPKCLIRPTRAAGELSVAELEREERERSFIDSDQYTLARWDE